MLALSAFAGAACVVRGVKSAASRPLGVALRAFSAGSLMPPPIWQRALQIIGACQKHVDIVLAFSVRADLQVLRQTAQIRDNLPHGIFKVH